MNAYFGVLTDNSFKDKEVFNVKKLFVANSLADPFHPRKEVHNAVLGFFKKANPELGNGVSFKYVTYENNGHVPFPSFYDGLKYVLEKNE